MNIENLPEISNNKDLTQHFFYSYAHQQKIGPSENIKSIFKDNLIFDRSRKSIFAQGQEFGYICDKHVSIDMGSYYGSPTSYLDIFAYEGEINAYSFVPWYVTSFKANTSPSDASLSYGSILTVSTFSWIINGSSNRLHFDDQDIDNPIKSNDVKSASCYITYSINGTPDIELWRGSNGEFASKGYKSIFGPWSIGLSSIGKVEFKLSLSCSECPLIYSEQIICNHEVMRKLVIAKVSYNHDFFDTKAYLETAANASSIETKLNALTNDPSLESLLCDNGYNEFYCVAIPSIVHNADILYGNLNNGTSQEFAKIVPSTAIANAMMPGGSIRYSFYLSTNHSWKGSMLSFKTFVSKSTSTTLKT